MAQNEPLVSLKNVSKSFYGRTVIDRISFDIYKGETFVIMGCSGSGKSTLLRLITGAIKPDLGTIHIKGKNIVDLNPKEFDDLKKSFGMVFQYSALLDSLSVGENVALPLREHTSMSENMIKIIVKMKLALVGLSGIEKYFPSEISGGMRKRVGFARAIALDPEVVFYDEPTSGLDPVFSGLINQLIMELNKKLMITSVVVTHDMQSVFSIADRVAMIHEGKLIQLGTSQEIKNSDNPYVKQFITGIPEGPIDFYKDRSSDFLEEFSI